MVKLYIANEYSEISKFVEKEYVNFDRCLVLLKKLDLDIENKLRENYDSKIIYKKIDVDNIRTIRNFIKGIKKPNSLLISGSINYHLIGYNITYINTEDEKIKKYYKIIK